MITNSVMKIGCPIQRCGVRHNPLIRNLDLYVLVQDWERTKIVALIVQEIPMAQTRGEPLLRLLRLMLRSPAPDGLSN